MVPMAPRISAATTLTRSMTRLQAMVPMGAVIMTARKNTDMVDTQDPERQFDVAGEDEGIEAEDDDEEPAGEG